MTSKKTTPVQKTTKKIELPQNVVGKREDQERVRLEDFLSIYSNNVGIAISNWDIIISFGRMIGKNKVKEQVEVIMSKEMAKVLTILLTTHLKSYEETFGEIVVPDITRLSE